jgi:hypothetical protein
MAEKKRSVLLEVILPILGEPWIAAIFTRLQFGEVIVESFQLSHQRLHRDGAFHNHPVFWQNCIVLTKEGQLSPSNSSSILGSLRNVR